MFSSILVVCVGNICRSPIGEGIAAQMLPNARVSSAGIAALVGRAADPHSLALLEARGIDLAAHRARQLTPELVRDHELVLVMESWQVREVERIAPAARGRVYRLGHWGNFEIADPYQQPRAAFERALVDIERGLVDLKSALKIP